MDEQYNEACELYDMEEYEKAYKIFYSLAEDGDCESQRNIANMLLHGLGVKSDENLAHKWYQKVADSGDAHVQHLISGCYIHGMYGFEQSDSQGVKYLQKAAEQNYAPAKHDLAIMYFNGNGVAVDKNKAKQLLEENCSIDYEESLELLATYYLRGMFGFWNKLKGFKYTYQLFKVYGK